MTHGRQPTRRREPGHSGGWPGRLHRSFESGFERLREDYTELLTLLLTRRAIVPIAAVLIVALGGVMLMLIGRDFFPAIDAGQIKLHVRAPAGARIESTEALFQAVEDKLRDVIPDQERELIVDDIGVPQRVYNLAFTDGSTIGPNDGVILVALREGHAPTESYIRKLREVLPSEFPEATFYFQAADMVTQILNFGLPAQIDVRTVGRDRATNLRVAQELRRRIAAIPGIVDPHIQQEIDAPPSTSHHPCRGQQSPDTQFAHCAKDLNSRVLSLALERRDSRRAARDRRQKRRSLYEPSSAPRDVLMSETFSASRLTFQPLRDQDATRKPPAMSLARRPLAISTRTLYLCVYAPL